MPPTKGRPQISPSHIRCEISFTYSVAKMTSYYVELSLNITFSLFVILHVGLFCYISWHVFWMHNESKTGRMGENRTENVRPLCLGYGPFIRIAFF